MSPAASVKNVLTQAGREPASLRSPAYLSTTAPHFHMKIAQNFWYLKMFFVIQTWQIYMKFRYIYLQTYLSKRVFLNCIFCGKTWPLGSSLKSVPTSLPLRHTYTNDNWAKLLVSKTAFCHSNMANIYEVQVYIAINIWSKRVERPDPKGLSIF